MKFERRVRALEAKLITDPVVLHFADGSTREMRGRGHFLLQLLCGACGGLELRPEQAAQLELIRQSVAAQEPGGGRMVEVLRCCLQGPAEERGSVTAERF
jgi:hypothetical protein